jgi:hypothetical protein
MNSATTLMTSHNRRYLTSFERVAEYNSVQLPQEPEFHKPADAPFTRGEVRFTNASLRYRPGLPLVQCPFFVDRTFAAPPCD